MKYLFALVAAIMKAICESFLNKPIGKKETFRDAKGDTDTDSVFDSTDW